MYGDFGGGRGGPRRSFAPVKEGDEVEVEIESVGEKGDGIAKIEGFVLFVPGTKVGDHVKVRVTRVLRKVGFADVVGKGSEAPKESEAPSEAPAEEAPKEAEPEAPSEAPAEEEKMEDTEDF